MPEPVVVGESPLSATDVVAVARRRAPVELAAALRDRLERERSVVDGVVRRGELAYGVTTGLGSRSTHALPHDELAEFSLRTVRGRAHAVGEPLPAEHVRAALLARLGGFAAGGSGVSPAVADLLTGMLNAGVHPVVPSTGSIGASDLTQMAHVGLVVVGEGSAEIDGETLDAAVALRKAGLSPATLGPKDGLVLCGASPVAAGIGGIVVADARAAWQRAQEVAALTYEGFRANTSPLDARAQQVRPAPGQTESAEHLLGLLAGGELTDPRHARRVQDPVSIRCVAQVHGALWAAVSFASDALLPELNGSGDNPLVFTDSDAILSTGNFHTPGLALALDTLALASCQTAACSVERTQRLLDPKVSGLPANLSPHGPERSGLAPVVKTAQAVVAELRHEASPVSVDRRTGAAGVEDDSTNASLGARRLARMLAKLRYVSAIEALAAAQAVDLAAPPRLGEGPARVHARVRELVEPLDDDRGLADDIERLAHDG